MSTNIKELVEKYKSFKQGLSKEDSWDIWLSISGHPELGIAKVDENRKYFSFRVYDDTPSVSVGGGLIAYDFGDGQRFDPVGRIMEVTSIGFQEAVILFMSWIGENTDIVAKTYVREKEKKSEPAPYKPNYMRRLVSDRNRYKSDYHKLAIGLFRGCSDKERKYAESVLHIGYIKKTEGYIDDKEIEGEYVDRIFIPEMDIAGIPYGSYRYNRTATPKGLIRKNSRRVLFGSHMIPKYGDTIIVSEGHSDTVVNIAKHYACVTTGSSTKKFLKNIDVLKGKTIFDFPDLDIAGMKGAMSRHVEIDTYNREAEDIDKINHIIFWWADWIKSKKVFEKLNLSHVEKGDDFYDIASLIPTKNGFAAFNKDILFELQKKICEKQKWVLTEELSILNWKVIFKNQAKNQGFDFVDLYEDNDSFEKERLLRMLNTRVKF